MPRIGRPENLKPIKPGEKRNPYGRRGKSGTGGFSMLSSFKAYIEEAHPGTITSVWNGLVRKAKEGDTKAIELIVRLNQERIDAPTTVQVENGPQIIINMPPKLDNSD